MKRMIERMMERMMKKARQKNEVRAFEKERGGNYSIFYYHFYNAIFY